MRIGIVQFPGSNCERETMLAVKRAEMEPVEFLWNEPKEKLAQFDGYIIVGGFSYEDRSRAGIIAALDPLMGVISEQSKKGKPILGICNGAQILVESGLVPGLEKNKVGLALTQNKRIYKDKVIGTGYYNGWVSLCLSENYQYNAFTRRLNPNAIFSVPVAHTEGRFVIPQGLLKEMQENGLNLFKYCDLEGRIIDSFPVNPNGSINNIAAVSNKAGNVLAMMPHPERTKAGDPIFQSMRDFIAEGYKQKVAPLHYHPRLNPIKKFHTNNHELIIDLRITDNAAITIEMVLKNLGISAKIKRYAHWEIEVDSEETLKTIQLSNILYNTQKELLIEANALQENSKKFLLVREKENIIGREKQQMLKKHFGIAGISSITYGLVWQIEAPDFLLTEIINSSILFNPYAHDCYYYSKTS